MSSGTETRSSALTELVRILRDQLQHKDERIALLEALLADANQQLADRERDLARLAALQLEPVAEAVVVAAPLHAAAPRAAEPMAVAASARHDAAPLCVPREPDAPAGPCSVPSSVHEPTEPPTITPELPADPGELAPPASLDPDAVQPVDSAIGEIAARVFAAARMAPSPIAPEERTPHAVAATEIPAVQRVRAGEGRSDPDVRTLRLDRDELARAHADRAGDSGLARLLPWRGRSRRG